MFGEFPRPRLVISRCFYERSRYDGGEIKDPWVERLKPWIEPLLVCPEVGLGLSVPRPKIVVLLKDGQKRFFQESTGLDLTEAIQQFSKDFLQGLSEVDGFLLKAKSPSCGLSSARLYVEGRVQGRTDGFFAEAVKKYFTIYPLIDEGKLRDVDWRDNFFTQIFALAELRLFLKNPSVRGLIEFHTRHKYLLLSRSPKFLNELGNVVAKDGRDLNLRFLEYERLFRLCLSKRPNRRTYYNVWLHLYGHLKQRLKRTEKFHFRNLLKKFKEGEISQKFLREIFKIYALRFEINYLLKQSYLFPYPEELS